MVILKTSIYPLKIHGKGALSNGRKRKIDLSKLVDDDIESCRPSAEEKFKDLSSEM